MTCSLKATEPFYIYDCADAGYFYCGPLSVDSTQAFYLKSDTGKLFGTLTFGYHYVFLTGSFSFKEDTPSQVSSFQTVCTWH
jgi:hypothetical protein